MPALIRNLLRAGIWAAALPLLVAAYPVLFLFAYNVQEQVTLEPLWIPLASAVGGTALVVLALGLLLRDWTRAALLAALGAAAFFGFGHAWNLVGEWMQNPLILLGIWVMLVGAGTWLILGSGRRLREVTAALTVLAVVGVALNVGTIAAYGLNAGRLTDAVAAADGGDFGLESDERPDVYYLIFDRYTSLAALASEYGFDNTPFFEQLEARGFFVARESHANYVKTPLSLVSSLSLDYLDLETMAREADAPDDAEPIYSRLRGRLPVPHALTELGYYYHHVANWWEPSATNADADRVWRFDGQSEFAAALQETTLLRAFSEPVALSEDPWEWDVLRQHSLYELARLDEIPGSPGPKYVFAHLLLPHDPYVFDIDGSFTGREIVAERGQTESYLRQLQYLNRRILDLVDEILASSETPPVIILQADEGAFPDRYREQGSTFDWRSATEAELEEKFGILNAVYLAGRDPVEAGFYPSVTPVNTFRLVFNAVFGADLPLLPDRVFTHVRSAEYWEFVEITDRLR